MKRTEHDISELKLDIINATGINPGKKVLIKDGVQHVYCLDLYREIAGRKKGLGNKFIGFIDTNGGEAQIMEAYLPKRGKSGDLAETIKKHDIEEVIIAIETSEHNRVRKILNALVDFEERWLVKIIPDM